MVLVVNNKIYDATKPAGRTGEGLGVEAALEAGQADVVRAGGRHRHVDDVLKGGEGIIIQLMMWIIEEI